MTSAPHDAPAASAGSAATPSTPSTPSGTSTATAAPTASATAAPTRRPARPTAAPRRHRLRLFVVIGVVCCAVGLLLAAGLGSSLDYFDTVNQALDNKATLGTGIFRLEGLVVPGSIHSTGAGTDFLVSGGGHTVPVDNTGSPPQLFQPDIPVVVVGHFSSPTSDLFVSNQIMVKHSASYIAAHPTRVRAPNGSVR